MKNKKIVTSVIIALIASPLYSQFQDSLLNKAIAGIEQFKPNSYHGKYSAQWGRGLINFFKEGDLSPVYEICPVKDFYYFTIINNYQDSEYEVSEIKGDQLDSIKNELEVYIKLMPDDIGQVTITEDRSFDGVYIHETWIYKDLEGVDTEFTVMFVNGQIINFWIKRLI